MTVRWEVGAVLEGSIDDSISTTNMLWEKQQDSENLSFCSAKGNFHQYIYTLIHTLWDAGYLRPWGCHGGASCEHLSNRG
mmetsp:Transcript_40811/g.98422  ORF Transcript_40811/g.98422 Transcript_40811/m.98422 type:complete len:80 (-) Transcript_40811:54-293(-)